MSTPDSERTVHPVLFDIAGEAAAVLPVPEVTGPTIAERNAAYEEALAREREISSPHADLGGGSRDSVVVPFAPRSRNVSPLPKRKRSSSGPARGEDALPHVDQRLAPEAVGDFKDGMRKVQQVLAALATERVAALPEDSIHARIMKQKRLDDING